MEPIRISVHFSEKDYIRLNYLMSYRNPLLWFPTLLGLGVAAYTIYAISLGKPDSWFGIFISSVILVYAPVRIFFRSRKIFRKATKAVDVTYAFDPEGFNVTGKDLGLSATWKQVHSVREIGSWYVIYMGPNRAHYLPKACFTSKEQETKFRTMLRETGRYVKLKNMK